MTFEERMIKASEEAFDNREKAKLSRTRNKVLARHLLHYALRTKTTMTLEAIGKTTGRDHATVSHSINYIRDNAEYDSYIATLKKCIDKEVVLDIFKIREKLMLVNNTNRGSYTRIEGIFNVIFKHIDLFQYENANILQQDKVPSETVRKETRADSLEREMRGA